MSHSRGSPSSSRPPSTFVLGGVWYGVFGKAWLAALGKRHGRHEPQGPEAVPDGGGRVFVNAVALAWVIRAIPDCETVVQAAALGTFVGVGVVLASAAKHYAFSGWSARLLAHRSGPGRGWVHRDGYRDRADSISTTAAGRPEPPGRRSVSFLARLVVEGEFVLLLDRVRIALLNVDELTGLLVLLPPVIASNWVTASEFEPPLGHVVLGRPAHLELECRCPRSRRAPGGTRP